MINAREGVLAAIKNDQLTPFRERVEQQRRTVEALKLEGHECPDAERQLHRMLGEMQRGGVKPEQRQQ